MYNDKPQGERVRENTSPTQNDEINKKIIENINEFAGKGHVSISERIKSLDKEWDIERVLELNMSILSLTGIILALTVNIYWMALPVVVLLFFVQHAIQGWCPPIPIFRAFKIRTRPEIDREKYALKALRGDFNTLSNDPSTKAESAFIASQKV